MPSERAVIIFAIVALLLLFALVALLPKETPPTGDLALTFLGVINNPTRSFRPVRLGMVQGTKGLCAVFRISTVTSNYFIDYHGLAIEVRTNANSPWQTFKSKSTDNFMGGTWMPGYSSLFAMQWPPEAPTNSTWRVVVDVERQRRGVRRMINERLGWQLFWLPNYAEHTVWRDPAGSQEEAAEAARRCGTRCSALGHC